MHIRTCGHRGNCTGTPTVRFDTDTKKWQANCSVCGRGTLPADDRADSLTNWNEARYPEPPKPVSKPAPAVPAASRSRRRGKE